MRAAWSRAAVVLMALSPAAAYAAGIDIRHEPLDCVPSDQYIRIAAQGSPPDQVKSAELQFRVDSGGAWYSTPMTEKDAEWSATLPRPSRSLGRFEYRVRMTSADPVTTETPPATVSVRDDPAACASAGLSSVSSSIVVRVPPGAPVVPPVPAGFSPTGVVVAQEREPAKSKRTPMLVGGVAVAGVIAGALAAGAPGTAPSALDIPSFSFDGTSPNPDTTLSVRSRLSVFVRMSREPEQPLTFAWRFDLRSAEPSGAVCVYMSDVFNGAQRPVSLTLTAPLVLTGACGDRFSVSVGRLWILIRDEIVLDVTMRLPFRFEP